MNINNVRGYFEDSIDLVKNDPNYGNLNFKKVNLDKPIENKDKIHISNSARDNISRGYGSPTRGIGLSLDKGTAANTTLYVDRGTFNQIANYTTNNPDCKWDEIGVDGEKRWIVVNGQRFECPLSKEEKEMRRRMAEESDLISILSKAEKENKVHKSKEEKQESLKLTFDKNNKIELEGSEGCQSNEKIKNLMKNDKVINMLSHIMQINGVKGITLAV